MKRRQLLKMLAVAPLIPLAAKLAPLITEANQFRDIATFTIANTMPFAVGDAITLYTGTGRKLHDDGKSFKITKIVRGTVTLE